MRVLVTGASGFVGREVLRQLDGRADVFALSRTLPDAPCAAWVEHDLLEPLEAAGLPDRVDAVVALAQSRDYRAFPERAHEIFAVNVRATLDLLEYARAAGAETFVYTSTGGLYGQSELARETDPATAEAPDPSLRFYLNSKRASEAMVDSYASLLRTVVLRPFFVYGPGESRMLIRTLAERVAAGERVTVVGDPGMRINPIYVRDMARAADAALRSDAEGIFNLAGDEQVTIRELVEMIAAAAGVSPDIVGGPGDSGQLIGDNTRMREVLGVTPETPLSDGLRALLADVGAR
jgi:nucleoside-diphosphate-sugar epimerase